jgi:uncharacterized protein YegP (UPF0339 family)
MAAKFEIVQPKAGEFRWVLTSQGRVLAKSDAYTRKVSCQNAMESFRKAAPAATVVDHTARPAKAAAPKTVPGKVARTTGRVVGKAAAKVAEVPSLVTSAVEKVVETVTPTPAPRKRTAKAR